MYVRFFVPEEYYCRPINIIPRPYYGAPSSAWSTREAYPTFSSQYGWRDVCDPSYLSFFLSFLFFSYLILSFLFFSFFFFLFFFFLPLIHETQQSLNAPGFGFGQNSVLICPNTTFNPEYNVGTFSGMLYGAVPTSFEIEINVSPEVSSSLFSLAQKDPLLTLSSLEPSPS